MPRLVQISIFRIGLEHLHTPTHLISDNSVGLQHLQYNRLRQYIWVTDSRELQLFSWHIVDRIYLLTTFAGDKHTPGHLS